MTTDADYDLVIQAGRVLDPAQGIDTVLDVAVRNGRIAAVEPRIEARPNVRTIDAQGKVVTPGLIDHHLHCFEHFTDFGVDPDVAGKGMGVAAVVEQGTVGAATFPAFKKFVVNRAETTVFCYLSVHVAGDPKGGHWEFHGPGSADVRRTVKACVEHRDIIRGIKAHAEIGLYSRWGDRPLALAKAAAVEAALPLAAHIGHLFTTSKTSAGSPDDALRAFLPWLDAGDILVHPFTGNPGGILEPTGRVRPDVRDAYERGVLFDLAHGAHFDVDIARRALDQGFKPHIISSDIHHEVHGEVAIRWGERHLAYTLWGAMAKMMAIGLTVPEVIAMTSVAPAAVLGQQHRFGSLRVGMPAHAAVLELQTGDWSFRGWRGDRVRATCRLVPRVMVTEGRIHEFAHDAAFDMVEREP
jgi:dihydroorotase